MLAQAYNLKSQDIDMENIATTCPIMTLAIPTFVMYFAFTQTITI